MPLSSGENAKTVILARQSSAIIVFDPFNCEKLPRLEIFTGLRLKCTSETIFCRQSQMQQPISELVAVHRIGCRQTKASVGHASLQHRMAYLNPTGDCIFRIPTDSDFSYNNLPFGIYSTLRNVRTISSELPTILHCDELTCFICSHVRESVLQSTT